MTNEIIYRIVAILIGYVIGNFTMGYFLGKAKNVDIQHEGSGNVGSTNTLRTMGVKAGAVTFVVDFIKAVIAMFIVYFMFRNSADYIGLDMIYAGVGAILGHDFPVFLKFKGGKGIATSAGLVAIMFPMIFVISLSLFIITVLISRYVSLGSVVGSIAYGVLVIVFGQLGWLSFSQLSWLAYPTEYLPEIYIVMLCATALALFQHRANIVRLIQHKERKFSFSSSKNKKVD
ncbi:MAG: glycerol-3-phosphate 1-O-acyltransferase PlsY [Lachnospiraceae bacterium]|nr:glycerol-3-phosphate 1-O-acyltransferase PlsY [Lachnospiraceae bacterium]